MRRERERVELHPIGRRRSDQIQSKFELGALVATPGALELLQTAGEQPLDYIIRHLTKFVGVAGAPAIEQAVQYLKEQWALPTKLAAVAALGLGALVNIALSWWFGMSIVDAVEIGAVTGLVASSWHIVRN